MAIQGGPIQTGTISNVLVPGLRKVIVPTLDRILRSSIFPIYMNTLKSTRNYETDQLIGGFGTLGAKPEAVAMDQDTIVQLGQRKFTWSAIAGAYGISYEASADDLYNIVSGKAQKLQKLHLYAMENTREINAASILNNANSATGTGAGIAANVNGTVEALASSAHVLARGGTQSNVPATAVAPSLALLEGATTNFLTFKGEEGFFLGMPEYSQWIFHPNSWPIVEKIVGSTLEPFTNDNQINSVHAKISKTKNLVLIDDPYLTNTNASYFLTSPGTHYLNWFERDRLKTSNWDDPPAMVGFFGQYSRFGFGPTYYSGTYISMP